MQGTSLEFSPSKCHSEFRCAYSLPGPHAGDWIHVVIQNSLIQLQDSLQGDRSAAGPDLNSNFSPLSPTQRSCTSPSAQLLLPKSLLRHCTLSHAPETRRAPPRGRTGAFMSPLACAHFVAKGKAVFDHPASPPDCPKIGPSTQTHMHGFASRLIKMPTIWNFFA